MSLEAFLCNKDAVYCIYMHYGGDFFLFYCIFSIFFVPLWPEILPLPVFIK